MKTSVRKATPPTETVDDFRLEDFLPYRLSVAANRVSRLFARSYSEHFGLSIAEWRVLTTVGRFGVMSPSAVGEKAAMDKVKVSRATASLAARGLLKQTPDPADGRGRRLQLTRRGSTVHNGVVPLARELEATLAEGLGRAEWQALNRALVRINQHLLQIEAHPDTDDPD